MGNIKITLNGKDFGLRLNQKQIETLKEIKAEKLREIGSAFEKGMCKPQKNSYSIYKYKGELALETNGGGAPMTAQYKTKEDAEKGKIDLLNVFCQNTTINLVYDNGNLIVIGTEKVVILTKAQRKFLNHRISTQKSRAKNLFLKLFSMADGTPSEDKSAYFISWDFDCEKLRIYGHSGPRQFTPYFSTAEKTEEILNENREELMWYFTEFNAEFEFAINFEN